MQPVGKAENTSPSTASEKTPSKPFRLQKSTDPIPDGMCLPTPFDLFSVIEPGIETVAPAEIPSVVFELAEKIIHVVHSGIETTTLILPPDHTTLPSGEITITKFDTAPMELSIDFFLTAEASKLLTPHLPSLSTLLTEKLPNTICRISSPSLLSRSEEKRYRTKSVRYT